MKTRNLPPPVLGFGRACVFGLIILALLGAGAACSESARATATAMARGTQPSSPQTGQSPPLSIEGVSIALNVRLENHDAILTIQRIEFWKDSLKAKPKNGVFLVLLGQLASASGKETCSFAKDFTLFLGDKSYETTSSVMDPLKAVYQRDYPGSLSGQCVSQPAPTFLAFDVQLQLGATRLAFGEASADLGDIAATLQGAQVAAAEPTSIVMPSTEAKIASNPPIIVTETLSAPTSPPTEINSPTALPAPPTATPILPTATSVPPTLTSVPPTFTPVPPSPIPSDTPLPPSPRPSLTPVPPSPTALPATADVRITSIFYDGLVPRVESDEYAVIKNLSAGPVDLTGWRLNAGDPGQDFNFPSGFRMQSGQECRVYTNENHPESCGLSFHIGRAIWNNQGECGHLYDREGQEVSKYCYGEG